MNDSSPLNSRPISLCTYVLRPCIGSASHIATALETDPSLLLLFLLSDEDRLDNKAKCPPQKK